MDDSKKGGERVADSDCDNGGVHAYRFSLGDLAGDEEPDDGCSDAGADYPGRCFAHAFCNVVARDGNEINADGKNDDAGDERRYDRPEGGQREREDELKRYSGEGHAAGEGESAFVARSKEKVDVSETGAVDREQPGADDSEAFGLQERAETRCEEAYGNEVGLSSRIDADYA